MGEETKDFQPGAETSSAIPADTVVRKPIRTQARGGGIFALRRPIPQWVAILLGILCIATVLGIWWWLTRGDYEERIVSYTQMPSPAETLNEDQVRELWFERELPQNLWASTRRVVLGFLLAAAVGVPIGILCGCFPWVNSFLAPITVFGRNIPIAALIPLTLSMFGIDEFQKVMFIFIACVAFVLTDTATSVADVNSRYIDTAYTLGASRRQIILKVLVPLAMPRIFNSLRLLFGLAFGYIMLAELIKTSSEAGGLGHIILTSQRLNRKEPIYLLLIVIPAVALAIDRILYATQRSLFPYQYGSLGVLHHAWRGLMHALESLKFLLIPARPLDSAQQAALAAAKAPNYSSPAKASL
jgi:NitT/TauT family transport system permease protein